MCRAVGNFKAAVLERRDVRSSPRWNPTFGGEGELVRLKTLGWSLRDNLGFGEEIRQQFSNFLISGLLYTLEHY